MRLVMIAGGDLTRVSCIAVPETSGPRGPAGRPSACMVLAVYLAAELEASSPVLVRVLVRPVSLRPARPRVWGVKRVAGE